MARKAFGQMDSWADAGGSGGGEFDKDDFLNTKDDGKYLLRVAQNAPCVFEMHWGQNSSGRATRVNCALEGCPLCLEGNKPQSKFVIAVINRERGRVQLLEFGKQVYSQIANLRKDKDWGDPRHYDIKIDKDRSRGISNTYIVTGVPRNMGPMNKEEELMVKEFLARVNPEKFAQPAAVEEVMRKLGRSSDATGPNLSAPSDVGGSTGVVADDDFNF